MPNRFARWTAALVTLAAAGVASAQGQVDATSYDFGKYGSAAERKRILDKWDREVSALPKN
jgi:hypothetical protein